jgi:GxxExxY protein
MQPDLHSTLLREIIGAFYDVYNTLGYGFLEVHYAAALERKLRSCGLEVSREHAVHVHFEGEAIGFHRLDMVVNSTVVVEIKATPALSPVARQQIYNYLRATDLEVGLLLHFGPVPRFQKLFVPKTSQIGRLGTGLGFRD